MQAKQTHKNKQNLKEKGWEGREGRRAYRKEMTKLLRNSDGKGLRNTGISQPCIRGMSPI